MNNQKGNMSILAAFIITFFLVITATVVDIGYILTEKQKLSDAVDAAALAGAHDLANNANKAEQMAISYAQQNGLANPVIIIDEDNYLITVSGEKTIPFFFAKAFGYNTKTINASAIAQVKPIDRGSGFVPLGVTQQNFQYGELYTLKYDPQNQINGNFGALALGGTGASNYENNLTNGYNGELSVGMSIETEPGNMSGPTVRGLQNRLDADLDNYVCNSYLTASKDCNRIVYLPVIDSLDLNGRDSVTIVGFAAFYLEDAYGNGNESTIEGRFLQTVFPGDWNDSNYNGYGLYAVKLVD